MFEAMYSIKRILAYCIDSALVLAIGQGINLLYLMMLSDRMVNDARLLGIIGIVSTAVSYGVPILVFGFLSGRFGWTPGKLCCFLRVQNSSKKSPGIAQGILREIIKYVGISFMFLGGIWAIYGIVTKQKTFYDDWLQLNVEDIKPSGLTETQKNWRKTYRDK